MTAVELAWGPGGARALAPDCDALVVVDVLSFTTCVSIAVARGSSVRPVDPASDFRAEPGEVVAAGTTGRDAHALSLSPQSMFGCPPGSRIVLPSPNGASVAATLLARTVAAASLRNAGAVAAWLSDIGAQHVGLVAAGERWPDGSLRPSYEDLVGAGAVAARLGGQTSPQATAAVVAYADAAPNMLDRLLGCRSGVELVARDFRADVGLAADVDADGVVPLLVDGVFAAPQGLA